MFLVYAADPRLQYHVQSVFPGDERVRATGSWEAFESQAATAGSLVVVLPWVSPGPHAPSAASMVRLRARLPYHPLVVITSRDADNARRLIPSAVSAVLWLEEVGPDLWLTLERLQCRGPLLEVTRRLNAASQFPAGLRSALTVALDAPHVVRSVEDLAGCAGQHRTTLWRQWREWQRDGESATTDVTLTRFLEWLLLLRAAADKRAGRSWFTVADRLGVHDHTIARTCRRLLGAGLRDLERGGTAVVLEAFERRMLRALLDRTPAHDPSR